MDDTVVLGGMFFQEFFGAFENDYINVVNPTQTATIYVSKNQISNPYIGDKTLSEGDNPFNTDNTVSIWVIVGICIGGLALVMIAACLLICCCRKGKDEDAQDVVYAEDNTTQKQLINNLDSSPSEN